MPGVAKLPSTVAGDMIPTQQIPLHPLRRLLRRLPQLRRIMLRALRPVMPRLAGVIRWMEAPPYHRLWFPRWQDSDPSMDAAILKALGDAPRAFLVTLPTTSEDDATHASLAAQIGPPWQTRIAGTALDPSAAAGRLVMHLQPGDRLVRHALAEFALAAMGDAPHPLIIYADEDRVTDVGRLRQPWFKTGFDPDLLLQQAAFGGAVTYDGAFLVRHGLLDLRGHRLMLAAARDRKSVV